MSGLTYIGTKLIKAWPMNRLEYNQYRDWELPDDEDGADEGYLVEYLDGEQSNHEAHEGYISWSPKDVFEKAYRETKGMTFGQAIEALKNGFCVSRAGWNGKGMWLSLVSPKECTIGDPDAEPLKMEWYPYLVMKTADDKLVPWLASQTDVLAEDWDIV